MDPLTHLEYALFQLTPTRTRCDLLIFSGKNKEKLASGLVEPFVSHLKFFKDQISKGGYSITLRPPNTTAFWFTKFTFQRLVRFINSPEVLERFIRIEREILQIENSVHGNDGEEHTGDGSLSSDGSTKKSADPSKLKAGEAGDNVQEESSKIQLQRLLETRKAMLRKEQAMAYARALVAGFETETMNDLIFFADSFGASRLREACIEFIELCKKKHNDGLWMDELAAMAAYPPSELAYTGTSGILITTESNASTLINELEQTNPEDSTDQAPSTPASVPMQMPWPNQIPQYMYNFPGPQGPRYPYPYPGMPPYYPPHMSWSPNADDSGHGRHHRSKKKSKSPLPESSEEEEEDDSNEDDESDSVSDSGTTVSKREKSSKKNRKKSSKTVVIRNINYITSNRKNSDGGSDDSDKDDVDGVLESLSKHHNKSSKSHDKKKRGADLDNNESEKRNENWDAFQNLLLKDDDVQDEHFSIRNDAMDMGSETFVKKNQPKTVSNDSFVVSERNGVNESRKVNPQDFENGDTFRMKGRDSSDGDMVISQRYGESNDGMTTNFRDLGSESSTIRNKREEDWFVVKNSEGTNVNSTFIDPVSMKGDVFSSEMNKKVAPIDDSFMVQPQTAVPYETQWRSTDVIMVEGVNKPEATDGQVAKTGFYEPDDLYLMVSRDSGVDPPVRSSWTPEMDYGSEVQFTKSEPKPAPVETKDQTEESPVKPKTKKVVAKPRPLSRSLPSDKRLPFVSRPVVHKSKREQEDEIRRKVEELAIQRQKRIAERTAASSGSGSNKTKTGVAATPTKPVNQKASLSGQLKKTNSK